MKTSQLFKKAEKIQVLRNDHPATGLWTVEIFLSIKEEIPCGQQPMDRG